MSFSISANISSKQPLSTPMSIVPMSSALQLMTALEELGFTHSVEIRGGKLICNESDTSYLPAEVKLKGLHRFEGCSDPQDMAVVYSLEAKDGTRGYITDAFGHSSSPGICGFINQLEDCRESSGLVELPQQREIVIKVREKR